MEASVQVDQRDSMSVMAVAGGHMVMMLNFFEQHIKLYIETT